MGVEDKSKEAVSYFKSEFEQWLKSQEGQTDAYEYEEQFVAFMQRIGHHTLSIVNQSEQASRNSKKSPN